MIEIYTPTSIKACVTHDDDDTPVDCFEDAVPSANPYRADLIEMLWSRWRYVPINSACLDRWLQRVKDRAMILDRRYQLLIAEYERDPSSLASIRMGWTETYADEATQTPTGSDVTLHEAEDLPQTSGASASTWLSRRDRDTTTPGTVIKTEASGTREHTDRSVLNAEEYEAVADSLVDPYVRYAEEFSDLFLDYYDLGGRCCGCRRGRSDSFASGTHRCTTPSTP